MKKSRITAIGLMLATFSGVFASAQTQFRDIPAGHWASQAVEFAVQCGLIEGFPDNTFRGNQNLTRYQAALIFFRLYQTNRLENTTPECRLAVERGAQEVAPELQQLQQRFTDLERTNQDQASRLAALEAEVKQAIETSQQVAALAQRLATLEQQVQQLAQTPDQPEGPNLAEFQARIEALEQQLQRLSQTPNAPGAAQDVTALEQRIAALEQRIAATEEQLRNRPDTARVAALEEQVRGLSNQITALQGQVSELRQQTQQPAPPQAQPEPRPSTPVAPENPPARNIYLGAGTALRIIPGPANGVFNSSNINISGMVGVRDALLGFGLRASLDYNLSNNALGLEAYLMRHFGSEAISPYLGVGVRFLPALAEPLYGSAAVGFDLNLSGPLSLFVEGNPRFESGGNFGLGARAGLKLNF